MEANDHWHFDLRLYLKPALGELYKKDSVCTKIRLFKIQNLKKKIFLGRGHSPLPRPLPGREGTPPPRAKVELSVPRVIFFRKQPLMATFSHTWVYSPIHYADIWTIPIL